MVGETKYIRMKFYLEGKFNKGTVYLEKKTVTLRCKISDFVTQSFLHCNRMIKENSNIVI